jgi:hypothetical protein
VLRLMPSLPADPQGPPAGVLSVHCRRLPCRDLHAHHELRLLPALNLRFSAFLSTDRRSIEGVQRMSNTLMYAPILPRVRGAM